MDASQKKGNTKMKSPVFCIYDSKAAAFLPSWDAPTVGVGLRRWQENCMNTESMFHKHPADFSLHEKESLDSETGLHTKYTNQIDHGTAQHMINQTRAAMEQAEREPEHFPTNSPAILKAIKDSK